MTTKRQQRAEGRMRTAKRRRRERERNFLYRLARRKIGGGDPQTGFCCFPQSLEMPLEEFLSHGIEIIGGAAYIFARGQLVELLPNWSCGSRRYPHVLKREYLMGHYNEDGSLRRR